MRWNLILPVFFVVLVTSGLVHPVPGQAISGEEIWRAELGSRIVAAALAQDSLDSAVATEESINLYDRNGTLLWSYPVSHGRCIAVSSDGERIAAGGDHLLLFDRKGEVLWRYKPESRVQGVAITADGHTVCAGTGTTLRIFSLDDGRTTANDSWSSDAGDPIESVSIDDMGSSIVAADNQGSVYFFSGEGRLLWNYRTGSSGIQVAISGDGSTIAAESPGKVVRLFNRNGRLLWRSSLQERAADVSISKDGSTLVLAGGGITMFDRNGEVMWTYATDEEIRCVSTQSSDATHILAGTLDGTVSLFEVRPITLPADRIEAPLSDAASAVEPPQTSVAPDHRQTTPQHGTALSPAAPVTAGACAAALVWWRRGKREA